MPSSSKHGSLLNYTVGQTKCTLANKKLKVSLGVISVTMNCGFCDFLGLWLWPACLYVTRQWKPIAVKDGCDPVSKSAWNGVKRMPGSHWDFSSLSSGLVEPVNVVDSGDGTHTVTYTPSQEGPYMVSVKYDDEEIPRRWVPHPRGMGKTSLKPTHLQERQASTQSILPRTCVFHTHYHLLGLVLRFLLCFPHFIHL
jgi:hypothetical protein